MKTELIVRFHCPQCGAPASLDEAGSLFHCEYCRVKSYLIPKDVFRYILPNRAPKNKEVIYFPYWWYMGALFACMSSYKVRVEPVSMALQAARSDFFPLNINFKTQVIHTELPAPDIEGRFFSPALRADENTAYFKALKFSESQAADRLFLSPVSHFWGTIRQYARSSQDYLSAFVGSTSLLYAPFYLEGDTIYDGISNSRVDEHWEKPAVADHDFRLQLPSPGPLENNIKFLPTLCPSCGWDMDCSRTSCVLACKNCGDFYKPHYNGLRRIEAAYLESGSDADFYLPFWRMQCRISGIQLESPADLIKLANLAKVVREEDGKTHFHFWIPAFKVLSHLFLHIAKCTTLRQPGGNLRRSIPEMPHHPVNFSLEQAMTCLKFVLSDIVCFPEVHFPRLGDIELKPERAALIYLPFQTVGSELVHPEYKISISRRTLEHFLTQGNGVKP